ncbi:MAG: sensor histidine kinase [Lachnospiraceae bacterium]
MKKSRIDLVLYIIMFLFAGIVIFTVCKKSNQAFLAMPLQLNFVGEYSQNGGEWKPLSEDTDLSSYDGDLLLKGRFDMELPQGASICFYLDHIGMNISVNGVNTYNLSNEEFPDMCGTGWQDWVMPALEEGDVIEIRLHNPHSYANKNAYNEMLDSLCMGGLKILKEQYEKENMTYRSLCVFILVTSIALIGTAVGYKLMNLPKSTLLLKLGIASLLMGVYMYLDTKDIFLQNNKIVFNTYARQIALMFAAWMFGAGVTELLQEKRRKIAEAAIYVLMAADFIFLALSLGGVMRIYDTGLYWAVIQGIVSMVLIILCIMEAKTDWNKKWFVLTSAVLILAVIIGELINGGLSLWQSEICIKVVFCIIFVIHMILAVRLVAVNYKTSIRAKKMEEELKENRLTLAMSQIQPHFIYNSLNSIYHLCDKDVVMAQEAISDFSDYLRQSLSVIERSSLIYFEEELNHVKTYLKLEQLRFGNDLKVVYDVETTEFMLPALSVQPLVENAVKHGICQKEEGVGKVIITVKECKDCFKIIVSDDGVGFTPEYENKEEVHVGIRNVRQRLNIMCNATLEIASQPGKGTEAIICIPKEN